jgi:hypothetical protein
MMVGADDGDGIAHSNEVLQAKFALYTIRKLRYRINNHVIIIFRWEANKSSFIRKFVCASILN